MSAPTYTSIALVGVPRPVSLQISGGTAGGSVHFPLAAPSYPQPDIPAYNISGITGLTVAVSAGTIAANTPLTIDLTACHDPFGNVIGLATAYHVFIENYTLGHDLTVDATGSDAWLAPFGGYPGKATVPQPATFGGALVRGMWEQLAPAASFAITSSSKLIVLNPGANAIDYAIWVYGISV